MEVLGRSVLGRKKGEAGRCNQLRQEHPDMCWEEKKAYVMGPSEQGDDGARRSRQHRIAEFGFSAKMRSWWKTFIREGPDLICVFKD